MMCLLFSGSSHDVLQNNCLPGEENGDQRISLRLRKSLITHTHYFGPITLQKPPHRSEPAVSFGQPPSIEFALSSRHWPLFDSLPMQGITDLCLLWNGTRAVFESASSVCEMGPPSRSQTVVAVGYKKNSAPEASGSLHRTQSNAQAENGQCGKRLLLGVRKIFVSARVAISSSSCRLSLTWHQLLGIQFYGRIGAES